MKPPASTPLLAALLFGVAFTSGIQAQVPPVITYQGRIHVDGEPFTGTGQFKFAFVDAGTEISETATATAVVTSGFVTAITVDNPGAGYVDPPLVTITDSTGTGATATAQLSGGMVSAIVVNDAGTGYSASPLVTVEPPPSALDFVTYWSNDNTSVDGSEPVDSVAVPVVDGLFTVGLGDESLANMAAVPPGVFDASDVHMRIWFDDGVNGFAQLAGDQAFTSTAYALRAGMVGTGAIDNDSLAVGAVNSTSILDGSVSEADIDTSVGLWDRSGATVYYSDGNVGIGDSSPISTLTVGDGDKFRVSGTEGDVSFADDLASITFPPTTEPNSPMIQMFAGGTINAPRMVIAHSPSFPDWGLQYEDAPDKFHFIGGDEPVMSIELSSRRVGIRTNSPSAVFEVAGDIKAQDISVSDSVSVSGLATVDDISVEGLITAENLRLPDGAAYGSFLFSDSEGDALWTSAIKRNLVGRIGIGAVGDTVQGNLHVASTSSGLNYIPAPEILVESDARVSLVLRSSSTSSSGTHEILFERGIGDRGAMITMDDDAVLHFGSYTKSSNNGSSGANRMNLDLANGNLGIQREAVSNDLEVNGSASKTTAGDWLANSDRRIKRNIQNIDDARETVLKLRPVTFRYSKEWMERNPDIEDREYYNFVAQEYREVFPESVKGSGEYLAGEDEEILQIDTYNAQMVTIKAVQELIEENRRLRRELDEFKHQTDLRLKLLESNEATVRLSRGNGIAD